MNIQGHNSHNTKPTLKTNLSDLLVIGNMTEWLFYKINKIDNSLFIAGEDPPKIGESISLLYDFSPYRNGMFGYEHLYLMIGRKDKNYIRYFLTTEQLEMTIKDVELVLDTKFALRQIERHQLIINKLKRDYLIT